VQALGAPGKTEKTPIAREVTENGSCVFRIHTIPGDDYDYSVSPCTPMTCMDAQTRRLQDAIEL